MILEYAQLLSTAHRLLDGKHVSATVPLPNGKQKQIHVWLLRDETAQPILIEEIDKKPKVKFEVDNPVCYMVAHAHHPLAHWAQASSGNYKFLYELFLHLNYEYTHRYGKVHSAMYISDFLSQLPQNISHGVMVDPPLSMPDEYKVDDAVISYQNLYVGSKARFAKWTNRQPPAWFIERTPNYDSSHFERTRAMAD